MPRLKLWPTQKAAADPQAPAREVLGAGIHVAGRVVSDGRLELDAYLEGEVQGTTVVVGPEGVVVGDLYAERAEIHGQVFGRIVAPVVVIEATATVEGRVFHHKLTVVEGAYLNGPMPWRPLNYFKDKAEQGGEHEHV